ncbi:DrmB family protein [Pseudonocardia sp. Cha107L01]|uniref:DrmB family protein n=1 Tax=Pseudonocardia sp. Cha107L01 TaxID=3457576 RepID=UPI00403EC3D9
MSYGNIRRAQLVAPFGVGSMTVLSDGTGVVAAGLDHWFERSNGDTDRIEEDEFDITEWRLEAALGVTGFRTPPDWRRNAYGASDQPNLYLTVPFLRFPTWYFCRRCKHLSQLTLDYRETPRCGRCAQSGKKGPIISQVPFVAICDYGHLQDFPFIEWVHRDVNPSCRGPLTLRGTGAASLAAQLVECTSCKARRTMARVTDGIPSRDNRPASSFLSDNLAGGNELYACPGVSVWHGTAIGKGCGQPLRGSLRAAANVYYALVRSAIFLPQERDIDPKLFEILSTGDFGTFIRFFIDTRDNAGHEASPAKLRLHKTAQRLLKPYTDTQVQEALDFISLEKVTEPAGAPGEEWNEMSFREPEYKALTGTYDKPELKIKSPDRPYSGITGSHLYGMRLVERLRETRALYGFSRINADSAFGLTDRKLLLRQNGASHDWLPAYVVNGEGILLRLHADRLREWEGQARVRERANRLGSLYAIAQQQRQLRDRDVTARFVLLHTLSHLLMNQLTFDCGYSSASLRERLFVGDDMAAVLIYTAAGDSEGTMGGLVRMGRPGMFESVVESALGNAQWCSADPICMESGNSGGQGPDSCNLAACHSCALVPETACEEFNRFLDRGLVTGTRLETRLGYFSPTSSE